MFLWYRRNLRRADQQHVGEVVAEFWTTGSSRTLGRTSVLANLENEKTSWNRPSEDFCKNEVSGALSSAVYRRAFMLTILQIFPHACDREPIRWLSILFWKNSENRIFHDYSCLDFFPRFKIIAFQIIVYPMFRLRIAELRGEIGGLLCSSKLTLAITLRKPLKIDWMERRWFSSPCFFMIWIAIRWSDGALGDRPGVRGGGVVAVPTLRTSAPTPFAIHVDEEHVDKQEVRRSILGVKESF